MNSIHVAGSVAGEGKLAAALAANHAAVMAGRLAAGRTASRTGRESTRHVWTGELQVGRGADVLTALLGSCVGIGMIWRNGRRCGLAHCLLPEGVTDEGEHGARYVSAAVPRLLAALGVRREQYGEVEVVLAGGASMMSALRGGDPVGRRNVAAAHAHLALRGLNVAHVDVGGHQGRRINIDCDSHSYSVLRVGTPQAGHA